MASPFRPRRGPTRWGPLAAAAAAGAAAALLLAPLFGIYPSPGTLDDATADETPREVAAPTPSTRPKSELERAVEHVRRELTYVTTVAPGMPYEYVAGLSVTSYVVGRVSAPAYGYLAEHLQRPLSRRADADQILRAEAGICGEASTVAQAMYAELGIGSRRVVITYPGGGHTTVEVLYADTWHWFDPTFGYFFRSPEDVVYSVTDVLQLSPAQREESKVGNDSLLWSVISRQLGAAALNGLDVAELPALTVELDSGDLLYERTEPSG